MLTRLNIGMEGGGQGESGGAPLKRQGSPLKRQGSPLAPPQQKIVKELIKAGKETLSPNVGRRIATLDIEDQLKFKEGFLNVYNTKEREHVVLLDKHGSITTAANPLNESAFQVGRQTGRGAFNTVHHVRTTPPVLKKDAGEEWVLRVNKEPGDIDDIISECFWMLYMLKHGMTVDVKLIVVAECKLHVVMVKGNSFTTVSRQATDAEAKRYVEATVDRFNRMGDLNVLYMDAKTQNMVVYLGELFFIDFDNVFMFKYNDDQKYLCILLQCVIFVSHSCINKLDRREPLSKYDQEIATYFNTMDYNPTLTQFLMLNTNLLKMYLTFLIQYYFKERQTVTVTFNSVDFEFPSREVYTALMEPEEKIKWHSFPEDSKARLVSSMSSRSFWATCAQQCTMRIVQEMRSLKL